MDNDPESLLNHVRALLKLRAEYPALSNCGGWEVISDLNKPYPYMYARTMGDQTCVVVLNPSIIMTGKLKYKSDNGVGKFTVDGISAGVYISR